MPRPSSSRPPDWSRAHLERPAGEVAIALLARFRALVGVSAAPSLSATAGAMRRSNRLPGRLSYGTGAHASEPAGIGVSVRRKPHSSGDALGDVVVQSVEMDLVVGTVRLAAFDLPSLLGSARANLMKKLAP